MSKPKKLFIIFLCISIPILIASLVVYVLFEKTITSDVMYLLLFYYLSGIGLMFLLASIVLLVISKIIESARDRSYSSHSTYHSTSSGSSSSYSSSSYSSSSKSTSSSSSSLYSSDDYDFDDDDASPSYSSNSYEDDEKEERRKYREKYNDKFVIYVEKPYEGYYERYGWGAPFLTDNFEEAEIFNYEIDAIVRAREMVERYPDYNEFTIEKIHID